MDMISNLAVHTWYAKVTLVFKLIGWKLSSSGHAWAIWAINSAYRTVLDVLKTEERDDLIDKLVQTWRMVDDVDLGWYTHV